MPIEVIEKTLTKRKIRRTDNSFFVANETDQPNQEINGSILPRDKINSTRKASRRPLEMLETSDTSNEDYDEKKQNKIRKTKSRKKNRNLPKVQLMNFGSPIQKITLYSDKENSEKKMVKTDQEWSNGEANDHVLVAEEVVNVIEKKIEHSEIDVVGTVEANSRTIDNLQEKPKRRNCRSRWTLDEGDEARKNFHLQVEKLGEKFPSSPEHSSPKQKRRSIRKRWSQEMKSKSLSAMDLSISAIYEGMVEEELENDIGSVKPSLHKSSDVQVSSNKRRTYKLDEPKTDINVLKSLNESQLCISGVDLLPEEQESPRDTKKVRFQHVTMRRPLRTMATSTRSRLDSFQSPVEQATASTSRSVSFHRTTFSPSPTLSSTPKVISKQNSLLKQVLSKDTKNKRRSRSADEALSVHRIKMPNFAKIHQRAMDRMEDIVQMTERKADRAKLLLSGQRATETAATKTNGSNRQLRYKKNQSSITEERNIDTKNACVAQKQKKDNAAQTTQTPVHPSLPGPSRAGFIKVTVPQILKSTKKPMPAKSPVPTNQEQINVREKNDDLKRNKVGLKAITKTKSVQDKEERRTVLKGVRSNRRFDLLMGMRKK